MIETTERCDDLIIVLEQVRQLLAMPDNDFSWSGWQGPSAAVAELDQYLSTLQSGQLPCIPLLKVLFTPTGPIQEVSISSGWGERFLVLARHFDHAIAECA